MELPRAPTVAPLPTASTGPLPKAPVEPLPVSGLPTAPTVASQLLTASTVASQLPLARLPAPTVASKLPEGPSALALLAGLFAIAGFSGGASGGGLWMFCDEIFAGKIDMCFASFELQHLFLNTLLKAIKRAK